MRCLFSGRMVQPILKLGRCERGLTLHSTPLRKAVALMRRIIMLATAAIVMAAMMLAMAVPAFAAITCQEEPDGFACQGGGSISQPGGTNSGDVGGFGGHTEVQCGLPFGCAD